MTKTRFPRGARAKRPAILPPTAEFAGPIDDDEELEAIQAYDFAKASSETPIPYEQVLRRIKLSRQ
jgi:hypothetical protein